MEKKPEPVKGSKKVKVRLMVERYSLAMPLTRDEDAEKAHKDFTGEEKAIYRPDPVFKRGEVLEVPELDFFAKPWAFKSIAEEEAEKAASTAPTSDPLFESGRRAVMAQFESQKEAAKIAATQEARRTEQIAQAVLNGK